MIDYKCYATLDRRPFYQLAEKYLPKDKNAKIVDLGTGDATFITYLGLNKKYKNLHLLDADEKKINKLVKKYKANKYLAPNKMPFPTNSVDFIHCSHMIEHLKSVDILKLFKEIDRVLKKGGIIVVSTPLDWEYFFGDISHIRPYLPDTISAMLCEPQDNPTFYNVSDNYIIHNLTYRYFKTPAFSKVHSELKLVEFLISIIRKISELLKINNYEKNGYTIVLEKG